MHSSSSSSLVESSDVADDDGSSSSEVVAIRLLPPTDAAPCIVRAPAELLSSRSRFFAARLSHRWNSSADDSKRQIDVVMHHGSAAYVLCIKLMAVPGGVLLRVLCRSLQGVNHALRLLHVAVELLFEDCADACLRYLEMLPSWTDEERESIRSALSTLQIEAENADLTARLSLPLPRIPPRSSVLLMRQMLLQVLREAKKCISDSSSSLKDLRLDPSQPIPESVILHVWNANLNMVKEMLRRDARVKGTTSYHKGELSWNDVISAASALPWVLTQLSILEVADCVVDAFAKDEAMAEMLRNLVKNNKVPLGRSSSGTRFGGFKNERTQGLLEGAVTLLTCMADLVCRGRVWLPRKSRTSFAANWLPVLRTLFPSGNAHLSLLFKQLIDSLPDADRDRFLHKECIMPHCYEGLLLNVKSAFSLWSSPFRESGLTTDALLLQGDGNQLYSSMMELVITSTDDDDDGDGESTIGSFDG